MRAIDVDRCNPQKYEIAVIKENPIIEYWRTHPSDFIEYVLNIKLYDYQKIVFDKIWSKKDKYFIYF